MIPLALPTILDIAVRHAPDLIGLVLGGKVKVTDLVREVGEIAKDVIGTDAAPQIETTIAADPALADAFRERLVALADKRLDAAVELMRAERAEGWASYGWRRLAGWSIPVLGLWQLLVGPFVHGVTGVAVTTDFAAFVSYCGIVATYLMGGHTLKEVMTAAVKR